MWKRHKNCKEWKKSVRNWKRSWLQYKFNFQRLRVSLTNKNLFVLWVWLKSQQCFFVILWYTKVDSNARLLKISFLKCLWSPSWKNSYCPSTNIMRMNRAICMIPESARICWSTFLFFGRTSWKSLDGRFWCTNR